MKHRKRRKRQPAIVTRTRFVCCPHVGDREQRVRVTNWMGQFWGLIGAFAIGGVFGVVACRVVWPLVEAGVLP